MTSDPGPLDPADLDQLRAEATAQKWAIWWLIGLVGGLAALVAYLAAHGGQFPRIPRLIIAFARIPDTPAEAETPS